MNWVLKSVSNSEIGPLANGADISLLLGRILLSRGVKDSRSALRFLYPKIKNLHKPDLMKDLRKAVERIKHAVRKKERILVYGDYDVDGITSSAVALRALRRLGAEVDYFLPNRFHDGYGMQEERVEWAAAQGYRVIISVDTGIRELLALEKARRLGVDCIVVDHHVPGDQAPPAFAVLNPLQESCTYPDKGLAAVGLTFKLAQGLASTEDDKEALQEDLSLAMIGTVADCAPLLGENRIIAQFGLKALKRTNIFGLQELIRKSNIQEEIHVSDVSFRLAPRINAAGRMEGPNKALELLLTLQRDQARVLAEELNVLNKKRQKAEEEVLEEAIRKVEEQGSSLPGAIVVAGEGWHRGVIGIVAQRMVERFSRPAFVISLKDGIGYGSGRSVSGFPLVSSLSRMSEIFVRYGGHEKAAGVTLQSDQVKVFQDKLSREAELKGDVLQGVHTLNLDASIKFTDINKDFVRDIKLLEPCGIGNPKPRFSARGLRVFGAPRILKQKHLKLNVRQDNSTFQALGWKMAERAKEIRSGSVVDLAFFLEENYFQGNYSLQLNIQDIGKCDSQGAKQR